MAMIPREGFIADVCEGQIDLYGMLFIPVITHHHSSPLSSILAYGVTFPRTSISGPFWTLTTLILTLYTTATLTASITLYLASPSSRPNSNLPLLSTAVTITYIYGIVVPALLWGTTKWLAIAEWGVAEVLGIYGYAMTVYVPISLLCLIPVGILRWILVGGGAASSGYFMLVGLVDTRLSMCFIPSDSVDMIFGNPHSVRNIHPVLANVSISCASSQAVIMQ